MAYGIIGFIIFLVKGIILTEVLTNAVREWKIFDPIRNPLKRISFFRELLDCFECTSVWVAFFVIVYLTRFEWTPFTYALIIHRFACFIKLVYNILDAYRAVKEKEV